MSNDITPYSLEEAKALACALHKLKVRVTVLSPSTGLELTRAIEGIEKALQADLTEEQRSILFSYRTRLWDVVNVTCTQQGLVIDELSKLLTDL